MTSRLLDKLAIILICGVGFSLSESLIVPVAGLLSLISASSLNQLFSGKKISFIPLLIYSCACIFAPQLLCGMPLILYDSLREKKLWAAAPMAAVIFNIQTLKPIQLICIFTGSFTAFVIFKRISTLEERVEHLRSLRDDAAEMNLQLGDRNRQLAEAQDNEVRLATLRERNRIAREIHDNVGHMLTRSLLQSGALIVINKDEQLREPLESLRSTLDSAMTSIRQSVHDLHDESVDLRKIIEDSANSVREKFDVSIVYDMHDDAPAKIKLCIAGIVKESLSNAVKHSNGDKIHIIVREHPGFYQLSVKDNGSSGAINETGIGLDNMRERAENAGGSITFEPSGDGFRIFVSIPKNKETKI